MKLVEVDSNIWIADGPSVAALGPVTLPTRMIVVRLRDGNLWINSPIEASPADMDVVATMGRVGHLVAPTPLHVWRLVTWKRKFPDAQVWGPPGARPSPVVSFDARLAGQAPPQWIDDIDQALFQGNVFVTEVEFFHRNSRTLIMTDFLQNYPWSPGRPLRNVLTRFAGVQGPGVPMDIRWSLLGRAAARASLLRILTWDFDRLIVAHGQCIERDAKAVVRRAFGWLL
jgi:hypothetical protein